MFQSGIDKTPYPAVDESAVASWNIAFELAAQVEPAGTLANELALTIWTMAHGFATLSAEGALRGGNKHLASIAPHLLLCKLLFREDKRCGLESR